jgi:7-cyano-7-deazaguanosine (preQ0) biosynthesis protein QueE
MKQQQDGQNIVNNIKISEVFHSVQGEGIEIGTPTIFVRMYGCNLSCSWCDSSYATNSDTFKEYKPIELAQEIEEIDCKHITLTGGEPLLQSESILQMLNALHKLYTISIETNGSIYDEQVKKLLKRLDILTISPKLNYINYRPDYIQNIKNLIHNTGKYTHPILKFVYEKESDIELINNIIREIEWHIMPNVYLMPEGKTFDVDKYKEVIEVCKKYNFKFSPRLQNIVWGSARGV